MRTPSIVACGRWPWRLARVYGLDDEMGDVPVHFVSYQFHESAHCVSDAVFKSIKAKNRNERILLSLLCESFANASESMAVTFVQGEAHRFFFAQNSYLYADEKRTRKRLRALKSWGVPGLFRLLWLSYLYANFMVEDMTREELMGVLRFALRKGELTKADLTLGTSLFEDAYELSLDFRLKTARLYMRLLGVKGDVGKNLDFNFSQVFLDHPGLPDRFERLIELSTDRLLNRTT